MSVQPLSLTSRIACVLTFSLFLGLELLPAQTRPRYMASYLGGNGNDRIQSVALGSQGEIYVAGVTSSTNLPTHTGALKAAYSGQGDGFVAKFSADGHRLLACTYLGGSKADTARYIQVMSDGTVWVGGQTQSADFPVTSKGYQAGPTNGRSDAFFVRLNASLGAMRYVRRPCKA